MRRTDRKTKATKILRALLTLFPLGVLEMARAMEDDRTGAAASGAVALSQTGAQLFSRTADFVEVSLSSGAVNPDTAAELRQSYEHLALQAEHLEDQLEELGCAFPSDEIQPYLGPLLAQIRSIRHRIIPIAQILSLFEER